MYKRGREAFAEATAQASVEKLHEWRKQTKYLWHQFQILQPICPTMLQPLADQLHDLSDYLGDDHDLAMLRQRVEEDRERFGGDAVVGPLLDHAERRRQELQRKAHLLGEQLYQDKPRVFVDRLTPYWMAWRCHKKIVAV